MAKRVQIEGHPEMEFPDETPDDVIDKVVQRDVFGKAESKSLLDTIAPYAEKAAPYLDPQHWIDKAADAIAPVIQPEWMKDQVPFAPGHQMADILKETTRQPILPDWDKPIGSEVAPDLANKLPVTPHQMFNATMPIIPLAEKASKVISPKLSTLIEETPRVAYGTLQGFSTPANIALVAGGGAAPKAVGRMIAAKFAPDMMAGGLGKGIEGYTQSEYGDWEHGIPKILQGAGEGALGLAGLKHAAPQEALKALSGVEGVVPSEWTKGTRENAAFEDANAILATGGMDKAVVSDNPMSSMGESAPLSEADFLIRNAPEKRPYQEPAKIIGEEAVPNIQDQPEIIYHGGGFGAFDPKSFVRGTPEHAKMVDRIVSKSKAEGIGAKEALEKIRQEDQEASKVMAPPVKTTREWKQVKAVSDHLVNPVRKVLSGMGEPGKKAVSLEEQRHEIFSNISGNMLADYKKVMDQTKPTEVEFNEVVDHVRNASKSPLSQRLQPLADVIKTQGQALSNLMEDAGVTRFSVDPEGKVNEIPWKGQEHYWPEKVPESFWDEMATDEGKSRYAKQMVEMKAEKDIVKASKKLDALLAARKSSKSKIKGFQFSRIPGVETPFEKTPDVWMSHVLSAADQIARFKSFGKNNANLETLVKEAIENGADPGYMKRVYEKMIGRSDFHDGLAKAGQSLRSYNVLTKLTPMTSMLNWFQRFNGISRTNLDSYMKGSSKSFTPEGIDFALRSGVIHPKFSLEGGKYKTSVDSAGLAEKLASKDSGLASKYLDFIGMSKSEFGNRVVSANVGKQYLDYLANAITKDPKNKTIRRNIEDFKINPDDLIGRAPTMEEYSAAARRVNADTQFISSVLDLPIGWQGEVGKTAFQFKPAAYKQYRLFKDYTIREAKKGNLAPIVTLLAMSQATGEIINDSKKVLSGLFGGKYQPRKTGAKRAIENFAASSGMGIAADLVNMFENGKSDYIVGTIGGPTVSDIVGGYKAVQDSYRNVKKNGLKAKSFKPVAKFAVDKIPAVGRDISKAIFK